MLISELARRVGVRIDTIRFYEKQSLLDETHYERTSNGYRQYFESAVQRLTLIRQGQASGFTLSEMREAIHAWETDELTVEEKIYHLRCKLEEIDCKINDLNAIKAYIHDKIVRMEVQHELTR